MKKTFITYMPDEAGSFLKISHIASSLNCNLVRISYNKTVDLHTGFIDAEGEEADLLEMERQLEEIDYLFDGKVQAQVLLVAFMIADKAGSAQGILQIINDLGINISYINSVSNGEIHYFKMGLFIDDPSTIKTLLEKTSEFCEIKILDYDTTETLLDSTIFYVSFAGDMRNLLKLTQAETNIVMANSNAIMQNLDARKELPHKTFEYIKKYAQFIDHYKGDEFFMTHKEHQLNENVKLHIFMPPCGSNIFAMECGDRLAFIDSGFACFRNEIIREFKKVFENFDSAKTQLWLTHADIDHAGNADIFDVVYASKTAIHNFECELAGEDNYRESNYINAPYAKISRVISKYQTPDLSKMVAIDKHCNDFSECLKHIGEIEFCGLTFDVLSGSGGHVKGETIFLCREVGLIFTGDNYVNIRGFSKEQSSFNRLAPFLMTSVNMDSKTATVIRNKIQTLSVQRPTILCPGHGDWLETV